MLKRTWILAACAGAATLSATVTRAETGAARAPSAAAVAPLATSIAREMGPPAPRVVQLPHVVTLDALLGDATLKTAHGRDFELYRFAPRGRAPGDARFRFLMQGGLHGDETQASAFVLWVARRYAHGMSALNALPADRVAIDFLPYANPDGTDALTRANAHGVNLNRNFGVLFGVTREYPGAESFSEPETRAIRRLFEASHYTAAVDVHGYVNWVVTPSPAAAVEAKMHVTVPLDRAMLYTKWTGALVDELALMPSYQVKNGAGLGDGGAFEDWAFWQQGTMAYCLELETFERYVPAWRPDFNDPSQASGAPMIDLFKRYEAFVARSFARAIALREAEGQATGPLAAQH
jgi:hypothetical protein